jgi:hypothetical protein
MITVSAVCPAGKVAIGGGVEADGNMANAAYSSQLHFSGPVDATLTTEAGEETRSGWAFTYRYNATSGQTRVLQIVVTAVCVQR